jgi:hypothetical protein
MGKSLWVWLYNRQAVVKGRDVKLVGRVWRAITINTTTTLRP